MALFVLDVYDANRYVCLLNAHHLMGQRLLRLITRVAYVLLGFLLVHAHAGVMTRESMEQMFPAPLVVGEKERDLPVWPIYRQELTSTTIAAYAFESQDFVAIPGFSGHLLIY